MIKKYIILTLILIAGLVILQKDNIKARYLLWQITMNKHGDAGLDYAIDLAEFHRGIDICIANIGTLCRVDGWCQWAIRNAADQDYAIASLQKMVNEPHADLYANSQALFLLWEMDKDEDCLRKLLALLCNLAKEQPDSRLLKFASSRLISVASDENSKTILQEKIDNNELWLMKCDELMGILQLSEYP